MAYAGMARHGKSSFNEGKAVRLLEQFLEQKDTIKTFFKENDRTPNYDGSMELVESDGTPVKKFVVQIKKCENLEPNQIGKNKGKYVYPMETNFLYYVKGKVTESPAIYFVVDIANERIFWLYLSDETLMNLDFEGKERISYPFDDADILTDIDTFSNQLNQIAIERNELFVYKTSEEIAEIQDALDYINDLLHHDLSFIKEHYFPKLWRFGLRCSRNYPMSISANGVTILSTRDTVSFALYPQIKGTPDTGIKEYEFQWGNFFNFTDMFGTTTPMEYARHIIGRLIHDYFEDRLHEVRFPDIVQQEQWEYDYWELMKLQPSECLKQVNSICEKWFSELPGKYQEVYDKLFEKRKYTFKGRIEYRNECDDRPNLPRWIDTTVRRYKSHCFSIEFNPNCLYDPLEDDVETGLLICGHGQIIQDFLHRKMLYSDSISCMLYQGICEELGIKCKGLCWGGLPYLLFAYDSK